MPPLISHASVFVTEYTYNSEATYNCSYSYRKTGGSNKKLCSSDRTWMGQNIVCESEKIPSRHNGFSRWISFSLTEMVCPVPAQIPNTTVEYKSLEWGGYAHYICKEGMVRTRDSVNVIYCQDNGTWEQATMKCHGKLVSLFMLTMLICGSQKRDAALHSICLQLELITMTP